MGCSSPTSDTGVLGTQVISDAAPAPQGSPRAALLAAQGAVLSFRLPPPLCCTADAGREGGWGRGCPGLGPGPFFPFLSWPWSGSWLPLPPPRAVLGGRELASVHIAAFSCPLFQSGLVLESKRNIRDSRPEWRYKTNCAISRGWRWSTRSALLYSAEQPFLFVIPSVTQGKLLNCVISPTENSRVKIGFEHSVFSKVCFVDTGLQREAG